MSFLPQGYKAPESTSSYYLKFKTAETKFRILSSPIIGWLDWDKSDPKTKKPIRTKEQLAPLDPRERVKHFWAMVVWDYSTKSIKILEITQSTIQSAITDLCNDENWGDPTGFDLIVKKTGEGMDTEYSVVPVPPKPLHTEIARLYAEKKVNLEALWDNSDPFSSVAVPDNSDPTGQEIRAEDLPF